MIDHGLENPPLKTGSGALNADITYGAACK